MPLSEAPMDEVENQQRLIDAAVTAAFGAWRSQLRVHLDESRALKSNLEKKTEELRQLQQSISNVDVVRQENKHLKDELLALQGRQKSTTSSRHYQELEHERNALRQDNQLKQKTIDALQSIIKYEKSKSKDWSRRSNSSPGIWGHGTSPHRQAKASREPNSTNLADGAPQLPHQALLQKLILPLENSGVPEPIKTASFEEFTDENALPVQQATNQTGNLNDPISFPGFDATYSCGEIPSELPHTTSPRPRSSSFVRIPSHSPVLCEVSVPSVTAAIPSDLSATPSKSCRGHECNEANLPYSLFPDSLELASTWPFGRNAQEPIAEAAEQLVCAKSEPPKSLQNAAEKTSDLTFTVEDSRRGKFFGCSRRDRDPQLPEAASPRRILPIAEDEKIGLDMNNSDFQSIERLSALEDDKKVRDSQEFVQSRPLQEIKSDKRVLPRTSNAPSPPVKKRRSNDGRRISSIAEDGADHNRSHKMTTEKSSMPKSPARFTTSTYRRLDSLLEGQSLVKHVLARPSLRISNLMSRSLLNAAAFPDGATKDQLDVMRLGENKSWAWYESAENLLDSVGSQRPPQRNGKFAEAFPESHVANRKPQPDPQRKFRALQRKSPNGLEDEEPFRSRPLHRLDLDHFKINPKVNAEVDYAHMDVIRNRDQRNCLPGCTRAECCGSKFRVVAGSLPKLTPNVKHSLQADWLDDASSQQSDHDLLMNFLGRGNEDKIHTLTSLARENLLLEAKTKIVADRYGKMHRHAHDRPKSPPGFWRTEMPGTQEGEIDRLDAKRRERDEVERRYREACRESGRWMFADE